MFSIIRWVRFSIGASFLCYGYTSYYINPQLMVDRKNFESWLSHRAIFPVIQLKITYQVIFSHVYLSDRCKIFTSVPLSFDKVHHSITRIREHIPRLRAWSANIWDLWPRYIYLLFFFFFRHTTDLFKYMP